MSENIFDIAAGVVTDLNAAPGETFSESFTAVFKIVPKYEVSELEALKVTVVPRTEVRTNASREAVEHNFLIDIGVQKKLTGKVVETEVTTLFPVVTEIMDYLLRRELTGLAWLKQVTMANDPVISIEHIDENRVFSSLITIGYKAVSA